MLKNFENWLLENKYSALTAADYMGRVERLCRKEGYIHSLIELKIETMTKKLITFFKLSAKAVHAAKKAEAPFNDIDDTKSDNL